MLAVIAQQPGLRRPDQLTQKIFPQPTTRAKHLTEDGTDAENPTRAYLNWLAALQILEKQTGRTTTTT